MKKMLCLFLCVLMVLTMVSCDNIFGAKAPKSAQELYDRVAMQMNAMDSIKTDISMSMILFVNGYEMKSESTGYIVENVNVEGDYYFYEESILKLTSDALSLDETQKSIKAYHTGDYFIYNEQNGAVQKLYSPMTTEEMKEYLSKNSLTTFDLIKDCATKTFAKNKDGMWELSCSGYTKLAIEEISEDMGLDDDMLSAEVMDMQLIMVVDKKYRATQMKIDFVFEETKKMPSISMTMNFSQYNEADVVLDFLDIDYTKVNDIRMLSDIEEMLDARSESESGNFTLNIEETVRDPNGQSSVYMEDNTVSFGEDDEGYFYDIDAVINKISYDISYKKGKQTIISDYDFQDKAQTEQEARDWIKSLIDVGYDPVIVTDIKDNGDGVYKLICDNPKTDVYEEYFESNGGTLSSVKQTITVTIKDGSICSISNFVLAKGNIDPYGTVSLTLSKTIAFE